MNLAGRTRPTVLLIALMLLGQAVAWPQRSVKPTPAQDTPTGEANGEASQAFVEDAERELLRLLNEERRKQGLPPAARDQRLVEAARQHSLLMSKNHILSHGFSGEPQLPQRLAGAGIRFDRSGENVAFGSTVNEIHEGLMKSPPHRENILKSDFDAAGVGVVQSDGLLWVTQNFARRLEFHTESEMENRIARTFEQARRESGRKPVRRERVAGLSEAACSMADKGKLDTSLARNVFGGNSGAASFSGADFAELPSAWRKVAEMPALKRYAVGVCFRESKQFPSGGYWAVLVFE